MYAKALPASALALACVSLASIAPAADWAQFGYDAAHSGNNTAEDAIGRANVAQLVPLYPAPVTLPAIVDGALVYAAGVATPDGNRNLLFGFGTDTSFDSMPATGTVFAMDADTGELLWSQTTTGLQHASSSPAIDPDRQYVYSFGLDGFAHKYRIGDGTEIVTGVGGWPVAVTLKPEVEKVAGSLTIASSGGNDYLEVVTNGYDGDFGDYQGHLVSIDLASGASTVFNMMCSNLEQLFVNMGVNGVNDCYWGANPDNDNHPYGQQSGIWGRGGATFDAATGRIYVASGNGDFGNDNPQTSGGFDWGDTVLALNPDGSGSAVGVPIDSYTPVDFEDLNNHDLDLGSTSLAILPAPPGSAVAHLGVQVGKDTMLRLLDLDDMSGQGAPAHAGGELQLLPVPQGSYLNVTLSEQPAVWTDPGDGSTWLFVASNTGLSGLQLALDADQQPQLATRWTSLVPAKSPIVANGVLYAASGICHSDTCNLVALDPTTGSVLWTSPDLGWLHWQSPILVDGAIYITDRSGALWKFGLPQPVDDLFSDGFDGNP